MPSSDTPAPRELTVGFVLSPAFTLTALAAFVDALRLAADHEDGSHQLYCGWSFLGADLAPVEASCGLTVTPTTTYAQAGDCDYLVVVGGLLRESHQQSPDTYRFLRAAAAAGTPLVGLCTGGFVLAEAGLMDGRRCCVHFSVMAELQRRHPRVIPVTDAGFVIDGGLITCPGSVAAADLAAHLIARHCGQARARKALSYLLIDPDQPRLLLPRHPYQQRLKGASRLTTDAARVMELHLARPFTLAELARRVSATPARLTRAFRDELATTPAAFWRQMRLEHARHRVVDGRETIGAIAHQCGFTDAAHLCRAFRAAFGATPQHYRNRRRL